MTLTFLWHWLHYYFLFKAYFQRHRLKYFYCTLKREIYIGRVNELWELSNMTFLVTLTYISIYFIQRHIHIDISWTNLTVLLLVDFTLFFDIDFTIIYTYTFIPILFWVKHSFNLKTHSSRYFYLTSIELQTKIGTIVCNELVCWLSDIDHSNDLDLILSFCIYLSFKETLLVTFLWHFLLRYNSE